MKNEIKKATKGLEVKKIVLKSLSVKTGVKGGNEAPSKSGKGTDCIIYTK